MKPVPSLGGSALNSARMRNWFCGEKYRTAFIGAVGADDHGNYLADQLTLEGVRSCLQVVKEAETGTCLALTVGTERTLIGYPGASRHLQVEWIKEHAMDMIGKASFIYMTTFLLTTAKKAEIGHYLSETVTSKVILNLSSENLIKRVWPSLKALVKRCHIIISNEAELKAVAVVEKWDDEDIADCQTRLRKLMAPGALVVTTRGKNPTMTADENGRFGLYPPEPVSDIVDTNGAGDAFVGGFLAFYGTPSWKLAEAVSMGQYCAAQVLKMKGFGVPTNLPQWKSS